MEFSINNRLMIDEIDAGIHYSRMKEFLKRVIQSAKNKNVQLFATTHSRECIEYYAQALKELGFENEGRIIKLADTKSGIKAYTSNYAQFENSLDAESEIR
jgi:AAA15 family ATPase/GTPase